ncbi:MAG: hypothetical protein DWH74_03555 [Planctomycetota bacterium]|nr:MAG: hypothetical protein DWH74_03555 [Planctomycetota bacterium]
MLVEPLEARNASWPRESHPSKVGAVRAAFTQEILDVSATTALPPDSPTLSAEVIRASEASQ